MSNEQRTDEWFKKRLGRFTSSRISELMGIKELGETGRKYALEMAIEIVEGRDNEDGFVSYDMQRGIDLEPLAFNKIKEVLAMDFIEVVPCGFFVYGENSGGSPDGLFGDDGVFDIKCPKATNFFDIVIHGQIDKKYIDQLQHQMLCTGRSKAISFQYCIYNSEEKWHKIEFERDELRISLIKQRIEEAVKVRDEYVDILKKNRQYLQ